LDQFARDLETRLKEKDQGLAVTVKHPRGEEVVKVTFADPAKASLLNEDFMKEFPTLEKKQGSGGEFDLVMRTTEVDQLKNNAVTQAVQVIRKRVDGLGVAEPSITRRGVSDIIVQLPGLGEQDIERAKKLIGATAQLKFRMVDDAGTNNFFNQFRGKLPEGFKLRRIDGSYLSVTHNDKEALKTFLDRFVDEDHVIGFEFRPIYKNVVEKTDLDRERSYWKSYYIKAPVELTGRDVEDARVAIDQQFNRPYTAITFTPRGGDLFGELSANNVSKRMAIMLDDEVKSAPVFQEAIRGGSARITMGSMRSNSEIQREAQDLVIVLQGGALQAPLEKQFETVVGPSLGQDSIDSSVLALILGSILVILFMAVYYRGSGVISVIALLFNIIFILSALALFGATLTLPGIAGIILTIGMAVDANVIIFERVREELLDGAKARDAIAEGYGKAFSAVMDANITTGIAGLVLLQYGTGPVKGFAVTLLVGIVGTVFTAVFISRLLFDMWVTGDRATGSKLSI
ncbi:MAG: protein translocase subunit SecD, partial [Myxococcota bacterium]|nr:protein translocase subunit SecD [Myxococcota bacterium]